MTDEEKKEFEEFLQWKKERAEREQTESQSATLSSVKEEPSHKSENDSANNELKVVPEPNKDRTNYLPIIIVGVAFVLLLFALKNCSNKVAVQQPEEEEYFVVDSIEEVVETPVSTGIIKHSINKDSIVNTMKSDFTFKKDEFSSSDGSWVEPKSRPRFRNTNAFYCYFWINSNNSPSNMRFVMQYEADDWLFIKNCIFNIDGENLSYIPRKMEHDNHSRIWEWFDDQVDLYNINLIRKIANAKSVKVKLNGSQYYDTRTIKPKEIVSIKKTLEKYEELGGKFN